MTDSTDLFKQESDDQSQNQTPPAGTPDQGVYIGEGKKYANVQAADQAFGHLNTHVATLEEENSRLRDEAKTSRTVDDVIESIKQNTLEAQKADSATPDQGQQPVTFNEDAIIDKAVARINAIESDKKMEDNGSLVQEALTKQYGEKAGEMFREKQEQLGVDLSDLARKSPAAVLEFFKEPGQPTRMDSARGTVNTATLTSADSEMGTHDYYEAQHKAGTISREEKFRKQHIALSELGPDRYNLK
jgi:hypothetical protein